MSAAEAFELYMNDIYADHLLRQIQFFGSLFVIVLSALFIIKFAWRGIKGKSNRREQLIIGGLMLATLVAMPLHLTALALPCGCDFAEHSAECMSACTLDPFTFEYLYGFLGIKPA